VWRNERGLVYTNIQIRNLLTDSEPVEIQGKVGSGATLLVIPESVASELDLPTIRRQSVKYANEETAERDVVWGWR